MRISVITACWNSGPTLADALESVAGQRLCAGDSVEHLVIDGGSTDSTPELLRAFSERHPPTAAYSFAYVSEKDRGMYDAINKGIARATGDVVGILNADDAFDGGDALARVSRAFSSAGDGSAPEALYGDVRFVRPVAGESFVASDRTVRYYSARHWKPWMLQWGFMPPHPSLYVRREHFARLGDYRLGYDIAADYELIVRYLRKAGLRSKYLPGSLVKMRLGGKSTSSWRSNLTLNLENVRANRENGYFSMLPMMLPKYAFKIWEFILPRLGLSAPRGADAADGRG